MKNLKNRNLLIAWALIFLPSAVHLLYPYSMSPALEALGLGILGYFGIRALSEPTGSVSFFESESMRVFLMILCVINISTFVLPIALTSWFVSFFDELTPLFVAMSILNPIVIVAYGAWVLMRLWKDHTVSSAARSAFVCMLSLQICTYVAAAAPFFVTRPLEMLVGLLYAPVAILFLRLTTKLADALGWTFPSFLTKLIFTLIYGGALYLLVKTNQKNAGSAKETLQI